MYSLSEEQINVEWTKLYSVFERLDLLKYYDMDKLKEEITVSPCTTTEDAGTAYKGALLVHINMTIALAQRMAKMISGTFAIDEDSLVKCCAIMHLAKRFMFKPNEDEYANKRGYFFSFTELEGCLKTGERSALEAQNNGIKLTPVELETIKCLESEDINKNPNRSIMALIAKQANELGYAIEKERYRKITEKK